MKEKTKVISYIFRTKNHRKEILVFIHVGMPEAGIQVVGGTVEANEDLKLALKRELLEESGLDISPMKMKKIGETKYQRKDRAELNHRHYFEITSEDLDTRILDSWPHTVHSDGEDNGLVFEFYWLSISEAKGLLTGNFGELLP